MEQAETKIFMSGNSQAIRINKNLANLAGLFDGQDVVVSFNHKDGSLKITKKQDEVTDEFRLALQERLKKNREVMEFLKDK